MAIDFTCEGFSVEAFPVGSVFEIGRCFATDAAATSLFSDVLIEKIQTADPQLHT
jgi:hypothetical protein